MTVSFQNPGKIDLQAAMTFGVSAKVCSNPIGFFGTGLKYAIAVILRNGGKISIHDGSKSHSFSLRERIDRTGQTYYSVFMGNTDLRFSVMLGINWTAWQAFRELYSNVKDEGGYATNHALRGRPEHTTIVVSNFPEFDQAFEERGKYFLEGREPLYRGWYAEVYGGPSAGVYYRGILVHQLPPDAPSQFTYNLVSTVQLTEDRTIKHTHVVPALIGYTWLQCPKTDLLSEALTASRGTTEHDLNYGAYSGVDPSDVFLDTVLALRRSPEAGKVNRSASDLLAKARPETDGSEPIVLTAAQQAELETALTILESRFPDVRQVPLIPVSTLGAGVFGLARRGKMYIALRCFEAGLIQLVGTIFEEYSHVTKDFQDESRDFQNYLINLVSRLVVEKYDNDLRPGVSDYRSAPVAPDAAF